MRHVILRVLPLLFLVPAAWAQDDTKEKSNKPSTPAEQLKAIMTEVQKVQQEAGRAYREAKTSEEKQKILDEFRKKPQAFAAPLLELAQKNPRDPVAFDALVWIAINVQTGPDLDRAIATLLKDHSDKLASLSSEIAASGSPAAEKLLRGVLEKSTDHGAQGAATLALAQLLKGMTDTGELSSEEASKRSKEAEALFDRVIQKYADVEGLVDQAKGELFELR